MPKGKGKASGGGVNRPPTRPSHPRGSMASGMGTSVVANNKRRSSFAAGASRAQNPADGSYVRTSTNPAARQLAVSFSNTTPEEERQQRIKRQLATAAHTTGGFGDVMATDRDVEYLARKEQAAEDMMLDTFFGHRFVTNNPIERLYARQLYPDWFKRREESMDMAFEGLKKQYKLKLNGIQSQEDLIEMYRMEQGLEPDYGAVLGLGPTDVGDFPEAGEGVRGIFATSANLGSVLWQPRDATAGGTDIPLRIWAAGPPGTEYTNMLGTLGRRAPYAADQMRATGVYNQRLLGGAPVDPLTRNGVNQPFDDAGPGAINRRNPWAYGAPRGGIAPLMGFGSSAGSGM